MVKTIDLSEPIRQQLPEELVEFMRAAGEIAARSGENLYLVGGVVRDLMLKRMNLDLDLVVEGEAIRLAEHLARVKKGKVIAHSRFNTAKVKWDKWSVDIASARSEYYEKPGALPSINGQCDIRSDLGRRDFTINAMAIQLDPLHYGDLIDLFQGSEDLERRLIRILHDTSFKDDATRIWRAVRYEQRLDFRIEPHSLELLKQDLDYLKTISGDRLRHELELCLEEERPEKCLLRADELGILARLHPSLKADQWLAHQIVRARGRMEPFCPPRDIYLAFLAYRSTLSEMEEWAEFLRLPHTSVRVLEDTLKLKNELPELAVPGLAPSRTYHLLHPYDPTAILANLLASDHPAVQKRAELFLNELRHIRIGVTGDDLIEIGIESGPQVKAVLEAIREARLDGRVTNREEELALAEKLGKAAA